MSDTRCCDLKWLNGAACLAEAKWHPVLICKPEGFQGTGMIVPLSMAVCDEHKRIAGLGMIINGEMWDQICIAHKKAKRMQPYLPATQLDWAKLGSFDSAGGQFSKGWKPGDDNTPETAKGIENLDKFDRLERGL